MLGKTLSFALVGMVQVALVTAAALLIFRIPLRGNPLPLALCAALFLMTTPGGGRGDLVAADAGHVRLRRGDCDRQRAALPQVVGPAGLGKGRKLKLAPRRVAVVYSVGRQEVVQ